MYLLLYLLLIFSPELVASEFKVDVELYQSQLAENNAKSPSTPVKVFKKLKKVCNQVTTTLMFYHLQSRCYVLNLHTL